MIFYLAKKYLPRPDLHRHLCLETNNALQLSYIGYMISSEQISDFFSHSLHGIIDCFFGDAEFIGYF